MSKEMLVYHMDVEQEHCSSLCLSEEQRRLSLSRIFRNNVQTSFQCLNVSICNTAVHVTWFEQYCLSSTE